MVLRQDDRGVLAIGQASHAWISGQLARAWGNQEFGRVDPHEEVCLAAEQHDIGMAAWDLTPTRNPDTGLPHAFTEMPLQTHLRLWREGPRRLVTQSRYAALLVAMHGMRLYELRDLDGMDPADAEQIRSFMADSRELQDALKVSLQAPDAQIKRNSDLVWTWDFLSLALCLNWAPCTAKDVPTANGPMNLELTPEGILDPWPFSAPTLAVRAEGRRLSGRYESDEALAAALASARWETAAFELRRA